MLLQGSLKSQDVASDRSGRYFCGTSVRSGQDVLRFSALLCLLLCSSARFGTILASCWSPWDLKNIAFSLRGSSNSSFSLVSLRTQPWVTKFIPKGSKLPPQDAQKVPQRSPGALRRAPGEPQEPPETTPRELLGYPWASKRSPGVVLGASGPHFGAPRASFTNFTLLFQTFFSLFSSLFSSLFFLSFLVYVFIFILSCLFSLLSSPFSFRSSLRSFQRRGGFRVANWDPPPPAWQGSRACGTGARLRQIELRGTPHLPPTPSSCECICLCVCVCV